MFKKGDTVIVSGSYNHNIPHGSIGTIVSDVHNTYSSIAVKSDSFPISQFITQSNLKLADKPSMRNQLSLWDIIKEEIKREEKKQDIHNFPCGTARCFKLVSNDYKWEYGTRIFISLKMKGTSEPIYKCFQYGMGLSSGLNIYGKDLIPVS